LDGLIELFAERVDVLVVVYFGATDRGRELVLAKLELLRQRTEPGDGVFESSDQRLGVESCEERATYLARFTFLLSLESESDR
jgi:hypothetical protein